MRFIGLSSKKEKPVVNRLREIGSDGSNVFVDYTKEMNSLRRPKKITDYRNMLNDGTVEALFNILTMPILASEYTISASDESETARAQADFIRDNLMRESYRGGMETPFVLFLDQAMMALIDGFQVWEKVYRLDNGRYELKKLALRDSRSLEIMRSAKDGYQGVMQAQEDGSSVKIPAHKTFLFTHGKRYDPYYGRSIFTALWQNYDKKRKLEYLDSIALQNDAIKPKILKNTGGGVVKPDTNALGKALRVIGRLGKVNSVASLPENYEVEVLNSDGRDPHQSIERQNSEMARVFLANFMLLGSQGASSTGSFALSDTQAKMFRMSLESIMNSLAAHIEQYIIADLIDMNFSDAHYPKFEFEKLDTEVVGAVFSAFTTLIQKDRVSDAMASQIEDATAARLGFDIEKIKQQREEKAAEVAESSDSSTGRISMSDGGHTHDKSDDLKKLGGKWQELEDRFLDQIRPVYEAVAENLAGQVAGAVAISDVDDVVFPEEYRRTLVSFFKQGYQLGKVSASDELGRPAPKTSQSLTRAAVEYINWIIEKQQVDVTNYAKELVIGRVSLADELIDYKGQVAELLLAWFAAKLLATASHSIAQAVNSGRNSIWTDGDLLEYSAIIDSRTSAGCSVLDGKVMTWREWRSNPDFLPPRHFNCRSTFVKISDSTAESDITPPDNAKIAEIERIQQTPKSKLVKDGTLQGKMTKKSLLKMKSSGFELPDKKNISQSKALRGTNPNYKNGVHDKYSVNCQRCVPTYEMRRRGYDVEALPNTDNSLSDLKSIIRMWGIKKRDECFLSYKYLKKTPGKKADYTQEYKDWLKYLNDMPDGARVQIGWLWGDQHAGHTIMAEKVAGSLKFIDPQVRIERNYDQFIDDVKLRPRRALWAIRIDNREIDKDMIKLLMKESK